MVFVNDFECGSDVEMCGMRCMVGVYIGGEK